MKKIIIGMLCLLCTIAIYTTTAEAATAKSSYDVKKGSHLKDATVSVTGTKTKAITLKVKTKGTLELAVNDIGYLKGKEQVRVRLLNSKGKAVSTKYVKRGNSIYLKANVSKGTYKVVFTTKGIKKNVVRKLKLGYVMNPSTTVKTDKKKVYDILDAKGTATIKFVNDKSQTVRVRADYLYDEYYGTITVKDSKGKVMFKESASDDIPWQWHYLPKGTYSVTYTGGCSRVVAFTAEANATYSKNITSSATSKEKAKSYTGSRINFAYTDSSVKEKIQWLKVDTASKDYAFYIDETVNYADLPGSLENVTVYKEDGTKVEMNPHAGYKLAKGTGIYYFSIPVKSSQVVTVKPMTVKGSVVIDGERIVIPYDTTIPAKSSDSKEITGTVNILQESYVKMSYKSGEKEVTMALYDQAGKKLTADVDGISKVKAGSYTFKVTADKANTTYNCSIVIERVKDLQSKKLVYTSNKQATIPIKDVKANHLYSFYAYATQNANVKMSITIYENGKKVAAKSSTNSVFFLAKANKTYKAVIKTSANRLLSYGCDDFETFKDTKSEFKSTKKSAKTFTVAKNKNVFMEVAVSGKTSGWIKVKSTTSKKVEFHLSARINQGEVIAKIYNSKGTLVKTVKVNSKKDDAYVTLVGKRTYYVKLYSTDKKTSAYTTVLAMES